MSLFSNKLLLNILASGLLISSPLNSIIAATNTKVQPELHKKETKKPVVKEETKLTWQNYSFPESGFSVDFPKKPERIKQTIDVPKTDLKINYETFLSEPSDSIVFVVSVWDYPAEVDMSKSETNLQDGFSGMLSALPGSEVLNMKMSDISGFKALDFLVQNEDIYFQGKLIIAHHTLYQVFTVYKNTEEMKNNYPQFINSFKLINPEKRKLPASKTENGSKKVKV